MKVNPYLFYTGQCKEAFEFYAKCLGGKIVSMLPHAGTPAEEHVPPDWKDKIIHARMTIGDTVLMASDTPPEMAFENPGGYSVSLIVDTVEEAERVFADLSEGGTVSMPMSETFFAARFGMVKDRFGIPWMVNCEPAA